MFRGPGEVLREKWAEAVETLQLGAPEMSESILKLASAVGVTSMRRSALQQLGQQLLMQRARYQAALSIVCKGGAPVLQREATLKVCSCCCYHGSSILHMHAANIRLLPALVA